MTIHFDVAPEVEAALTAQNRDPSDLAKEMFMISLYRREIITRRQLSRALDIGWDQTDGLLNHYNVTEDLPTIEELREDAKMLSKLLADNALKKLDQH